MRALRPIVMTAIVGGASLGSLPVHAAVTGNVSAVSEYVFRGIGSSDSGAAVQGGLDWLAEGGLYAGIWGSSAAPHVLDGAEVDLYAAKVFNVGESVVLNLGVIGYFFPDSEPLAAPDLDADYQEIYASVSFGSLNAKLLYTDDFFNVKGNGARDGGSVYVNLAYTHSIKEDLTLKGAIGNQSGDGAENFYGDAVTDYSITLTKVLENGFSASFGILGTDLDADGPVGTVAGALDDDPKFVVTLYKGFEI